MIKRIAAVLQLSLFLAPCRAVAAVVSDAEIREILVDRIDVQNRASASSSASSSRPGGASSRTASWRRTIRGR